DFAKLCAMYSHLGKDSVLAAALAYNIGPGAVNKSTFYKKLRRGDRNIFRDYTAHCHYKGKFHKGLFQRRQVELAILFVP
ncbi:MAG: lysozyme, partial [Muribaculum sp.]|nr:lysozyme [Muribaculum sp.]